MDEERRRRTEKREREERGTEVHRGRKRGKNTTEATQSRSSSHGRTEKEFVRAIGAKEAEGEAYGDGPESTVIKSN